MKIINEILFIISSKIFTIFASLTTIHWRIFQKRILQLDVGLTIWITCDLFRDDTHMVSMKIFQFLWPPPPLSMYLQFQTNPAPLSLPLPLSPNDKQSIKRRHNPRITKYLARSFLQVGFCFQYQLINLVWLFFDFFSFNWSLTTSFFVALYSLLCVQSCA